MKRKRSLLSLALMAFAIAGPAQETNQDETETRPQMQQMEQMQVRMQAMRAQMQRIHATEDPVERRRFLQEHMQSMHEGMGMMGRMMRGPTGQGGTQQCPRDDSECRLDRMQMQQRMMGQQMGMMHQMMEQMMEHMRQQPPADNSD